MGIIYVDEQIISKNVNRRKSIKGAISYLKVSSRVRWLDIPQG